MSKRIRLNLPLDDLPHEEMEERDPFVPNFIKLDHRRLMYIQKYGTAADIDAGWLVRLLAGADPTDPVPQFDHTVEPGEEVCELLSLITDLMAGLDAAIDTDYSLMELRTGDDVPEPEDVLTESDLERYELYFKLDSIRKLAEFACEKDEGLVIG